MNWDTLLKNSEGQFRKVLWVPAVAALLSLLVFFSAGAPDSKEPGAFLFNTPKLPAILAAAQKTPETTDFIDRPLLRSERRPPVPVDNAPAPAAVVAEPEVQMEPIDGVALVGIFGSGDVKGIIVRLEDGQRERVVEGQALRGWTLDWVGSRQARFIGAGGSKRAELQMAFAEIKALPPAPSSNRAVMDRDARGSDATVAAERDAEINEALAVPEEPQPAPGSFGSAYKERRQRSLEVDATEANEKQ